MQKYIDCCKLDPFIKNGNICWNIEEYIEMVTISRELKQNITNYVKSKGFDGYIIIGRLSYKPTDKCQDYNLMTVTGYVVKDKPELHKPVLHTNNWRYTFQIKHERGR
jgi:hypothetical protein